MESENLSISVIIPCYNSSESLPELMPRLCNTLDAMAADYEVLLINDASTDNTFEVIANLQSLYPRIKGIGLYKNFGQQSAVLCGLKEAKNAIVITMDDDLQHSPEDIPLLLQHLTNNSLDLVIAHLEEKKHGLMRSIGTSFVRNLSSHILRTPKDFRFSSFRIMKAAVAKNALKFIVANPVVGFLLIKSTNRYGNLTLQHEARKFGQSNYSFIHLFQYCMTMMLDYSVIPLKLVGFLGVVISISSFLLGIFYFVSWFQGNVGVSGFTTAVLLVLFLFGLLFMSIGIIGAYFIRILQNSNSHPTFLVRHRLIDGALNTTNCED